MAARATGSRSDTWPPAVGVSETSTNYCGRCTAKSCRFKNACAKCQAKHPASVCHSVCMGTTPINHIMLDPVLQGYDMAEASYLVMDLKCCFYLHFEGAS